jgi:hypothetical protein
VSAAALVTGAKVLLWHRGFYCVGRIVSVDERRVRIRVTAADGSRPLVNRPVSAYRDAR